MDTILSALKKEACSSDRFASTQNPKSFQKQEDGNFKTAHPESLRTNFFTVKPTDTLGISVLAFSTQVRGFKPGRSRRIFKDEKILSTPSFEGEVKPSVPCRRFAACKKSLNVAWKSTFRQNYRTFLAHRFPPFATRGLSRCLDRGVGHLVTEAGTSKLRGTQGCTISL